jgi:hypothetical protein
MNAEGPVDTGSYEVGYGKAPKATRFGVREQPVRSRGRSRTDHAADLAALLDRPITAALNGKKTKVHPHEAMMLGVGKRAVGGEIRAMKQFLKECKQAGLLDPSAGSPCNNVLFAPEDIPLPLFALLVKTAGPPPWDDDLYARLKADYDRERADIQELLEEAKAEANEKAQ